METALMKIALAGGIILFIIISSIAASILSGLAALIVTGCMKIVKVTIAFVTKGMVIENKKILVL